MPSRSREGPRASQSTTTPGSQKLGAFCYIPTHKKKLYMQNGCPVAPDGHFFGSVRSTLIRPQSLQGERGCTCGILIPAVVWALLFLHCDESFVAGSGPPPDDYVGQTSRHARSASSASFDAGVQADDPGELHAQEGKQASIYTQESLPSAVPARCVVTRTNSAPKLVDTPAAGIASRTRSSRIVETLEASGRNRHSSNSNRKRSANEGPGPLPAGMTKITSTSVGSMGITSTSVGSSRDSKNSSRSQRRRRTSVWSYTRIRRRAKREVSNKDELQRVPATEVTQENATAPPVRPTGSPPLISDLDAWSSCTGTGSGAVLPSSGLPTKSPTHGSIAEDDDLAMSSNAGKTSDIVQGDASEKHCTESGGSVPELQPEHDAAASLYRSASSQRSIRRAVSEPPLGGSQTSANGTSTLTRSYSPSVNREGEPKDHDAMTSDSSSNSRRGMHEEERQSPWNNDLNYTGLSASLGTQSPSRQALQFQTDAVIEGSDSQSSPAEFSQTPATSSASEDSGGGSPLSEGLGGAIGSAEDVDNVPLRGSKNVEGQPVVTAKGSNPTPYAEVPPTSAAWAPLTSISFRSDAGELLIGDPDATVDRQSSNIFPRGGSEAQMATMAQTTAHRPTITYGADDAAFLHENTGVPIHHSASSTGDAWASPFVNGTSSSVAGASTSDARASPSFQTVTGISSSRNISGREEWTSQGGPLTKEWDASSSYGAPQQWDYQQHPQPYQSPSVGGSAVTEQHHSQPCATPLQGGGLARSVETSHHTPGSDTVYGSDSSNPEDEWWLSDEALDNAMVDAILGCKPSALRETLLTEMEEEAQKNMAVEQVFAGLFSSQAMSHPSAPAVPHRRDSAAILSSRTVSSRPSTGSRSTSANGTHEESYMTQEEASRLSYSYRLRSDRKRFRRTSGHTQLNGDLDEASFSDEAEDGARPSTSQGPSTSNRGNCGASGAHTAAKCSCVEKKLNCVECAAWVNAAQKIMTASSAYQKSCVELTKMMRQHSMAQQNLSITVSDLYKSVKAAQQLTNPSEPEGEWSGVSERPASLKQWQIRNVGSSPCDIARRWASDGEGTRFASTSAFGLLADVPLEKLRISADELSAYTQRHFKFKLLPSLTSVFDWTDRMVRSAMTQACINRQLAGEILAATQELLTCASADSVLQDESIDSIRNLVDQATCFVQFCQTVAGILSFYGESQIAIEEARYHHTRMMDTKLVRGERLRSALCVGYSLAAACAGEEPVLDALVQVADKTVQAVQKMSSARTKEDGVADMREECLRCADAARVLSRYSPFRHPYVCGDYIDLSRCYADWALAFGFKPPQIRALLAAVLPEIPSNLVSGMKHALRRCTRARRYVKAGQLMSTDKSRKKFLSTLDMLMKRGCTIKDGGVRGRSRESDVSIFDFDNDDEFPSTEPLGDVTFSICERSHGRRTSAFEASGRSSNSSKDGPCVKLPRRENVCRCSPSKKLHLPSGMAFTAFWSKAAPYAASCFGVNTQPVTSHCQENADAAARDYCLGGADAAVRGILDVAVQSVCQIRRREDEHQPRTISTEYGSSYSLYVSSDSGGPALEGFCPELYEYLQAASQTSRVQKVKTFLSSLFPHQMTWPALGFPQLVDAPHNNKAEEDSHLSTRCHTARRPPNQRLPLSNRRPPFESLCPPENSPVFPAHSPYEPPSPSDSSSANNEMQHFSSSSSPVEGLGSTQESQGYNRIPVDASGHSPVRRYSHPLQTHGEMARTAVTEERGTGSTIVTDTNIYTGKTFSTNVHGQASGRSDPTVAAAAPSSSSSSYSQDSDLREFGNDGSSLTSFPETLASADFYTTAVETVLGLPPLDKYLPPQNSPPTRSEPGGGHIPPEGTRCPTGAPTRKLAALDDKQEKNETEKKQHQQPQQEEAVPLLKSSPPAGAPPLPTPPPSSISPALPSDTTWEVSDGETLETEQKQDNTKKQAQLHHQQLDGQSLGTAEHYAFKEQQRVSPPPLPPLPRPPPTSTTGAAPRSCSVALPPPSPYANPIDTVISSAAVAASDSTGGAPTVSHNSHRGLFPLSSSPSSSSEAEKKTSPPVSLDSKEGGEKMHFHAPTAATKWTQLPRTGRHPFVYREVVLSPRPSHEFDGLSNHQRQKQASSHANKSLVEMELHESVRSDSVGHHVGETSVAHQRNHMGISSRGSSTSNSQRRSSRRGGERTDDSYSSSSSSSSNSSSSSSGEDHNSTEDGEKYYDSKNEMLRGKGRTPVASRVENTPAEAAVQVIMQNVEPLQQQIFPIGLSYKRYVEAYTAYTEEERSPSQRKSPQPASEHEKQISSSAADAARGEGLEQGQAEEENTSDGQQQQQKEQPQQQEQQQQETGYYNVRVRWRLDPSKAAAHIRKMESDDFDSNSSSVWLSSPASSLPLPFQRQQKKQSQSSPSSASSSSIRARHAEGRVSVLPTVGGSPISTSSTAVDEKQKKKTTTTTEQSESATAPAAVTTVEPKQREENGKQTGDMTKKQKQQQQQQQEGKKNQQGPRRGEEQQQEERSMHEDSSSKERRKGHHSGDSNNDEDEEDDDDGVGPSGGGLAAMLRGTRNKIATTTNKGNCHNKSSSSNSNSNSNSNSSSNNNRSVTTVVAPSGKPTSAEEVLKQLLGFLWERNASDSINNVCIALYVQPVDSASVSFFSLDHDGDVSEGASTGAPNTNTNSSSRSSSRSRRQENLGVENWKGRNINDSNKSTGSNSGMAAVRELQAVGGEDDGVLEEKKNRVGITRGEEAPTPETRPNEADGDSDMFYDENQFPQSCEEAFEQYDARRDTLLQQEEEHVSVLLLQHHPGRDEGDVQQPFDTSSRERKQSLSAEEGRRQEQMKRNEPPPSTVVCVSPLETLMALYNDNITSQQYLTFPVAARLIDYILDHYEPVNPQGLSGSSRSFDRRINSSAPASQVLPRHRKATAPPQQEQREAHEEEQRAEQAEQEEGKKKHASEKVEEGGEVEVEEEKEDDKRSNVVSASTVQATNQQQPHKEEKQQKQQEEAEQQEEERQGSEMPRRDNAAFSDGAKITTQRFQHETHAAKTVREGYDNSSPLTWTPSAVPARVFYGYHRRGGGQRRLFAATSSSEHFNGSTIHSQKRADTELPGYGGGKRILTSSIDNNTSNSNKKNTLGAEVAGSPAEGEAGAGAEAAEGEAGAGAEEGEAGAAAGEAVGVGAGTAAGGAGGGGAPYNIISASTTVISKSAATAGEEGQKKKMMTKTRVRVGVCFRAGRVSNNISEKSDKPSKEMIVEDDALILPKQQQQEQPFPAPIEIGELAFHILPSLSKQRVAASSPGAIAAVTEKHTSGGGEEQMKGGEAAQQQQQKQTQEQQQQKQKQEQQKQKQEQQQQKQEQQQQKQEQQQQEKHQDEGNETGREEDLSKNGEITPPQMQKNIESNKKNSTVSSSSSFSSSSRSITITPPTPIPTTSTSGSGGGGGGLLLPPDPSSAVGSRGMTTTAAADTDTPTTTPTSAAATITTISIDKNRRQRVGGEEEKDLDGGGEKQTKDDSEEEQQQQQRQVLQRKISKGGGATIQKEEEHLFASQKTPSQPPSDTNAQKHTDNEKTADGENDVTDTTPAIPRESIYTRRFVVAGWDYVKDIEGLHLTEFNRLVLKVVSMSAPDPCAGFWEEHAFMGAAPVAVRSASSPPPATSASPGAANANFSDEGFTGLRFELRERYSDESSNLLYDGGYIPPAHMRTVACFYGNDALPNGELLEEVVFTMDAKEAVAVVLFVLCIVMAIPICCAVTISCHAFKHRKLRKNLRRFQLVQQRDTIEMHLRNELGVGPEEEDEADLCNEEEEEEWAADATATEVRGLHSAGQ